MVVNIRRKGVGLGPHLDRHGQRWSAHMDSLRKFVRVVVRDLVRDHIVPFLETVRDFFSGAGINAPTLILILITIVVILIGREIGREIAQRMFS